MGVLGKRKGVWGKKDSEGGMGKKILGYGERKGGYWGKGVCVLQASSQRTAAGEAGASSQDARRKQVNLRRYEPLPRDWVTGSWVCGRLVVVVGEVLAWSGQTGGLGWIWSGWTEWMGRGGGAGLDDGTNA